MKLAIGTKNFEELLNPLQAVISDNHIIPILQNVKLEFKKKQLIATGDNQEISCVNSMQLKSNKIIKDICVNFGLLMSAIKSLTDKTIGIEIVDNELNIEHKKGVFTIPALDVREFPKISAEEFSQKASINSSKFKSSLKVANKFILNDDVDAMGNISIEIGKKIFIRSTDTFRLFQERVEGSGDKMNLLISGKASTALYALIEDSDDLEFKYNTNRLYFKFDNTEIMVTQQKGDFPIKAFQQVVDQVKSALPFELEVKEFVTALKRVSLMNAKDKYQSIKLAIGKKQTILTSHSDITSTSAEEFIESKFKKKQIISFDYKYLVEILGVFEKSPNLYINEKGFLFIKSGKLIGSIAPQQTK